MFLAISNGTHAILSFKASFLDELDKKYRQQYLLLFLFRDLCRMRNVTSVAENIYDLYFSFSSFIHDSRLKV